MLTLRQRLDWIRHLGVACFQQHHAELEAAFRPWIGEDAVVVDVGAHAGQFAKLFARMAPRGHVHAFEPSPYARSILTKALAWNRVRNVTVLPFGLSDAEGSATLSTPIKSRGDLGFGLASLAGTSKGRASQDYTVPLATLDGFVAGQGLTRLDFLKADVEGWELHVLRGGQEALRQHRPALFLEIAEDALQRAGSSPAAIWALLEPLGYQARRGPDFTPAAQFDGTADYLFVPT